MFLIIGEKNRYRIRGYLKMKFILECKIFINKNKI